MKKRNCYTGILVVACMLMVVVVIFLKYCIKTDKNENIIGPQKTPEVVSVVEPQKTPEVANVEEPTDELLISGTKLNDIATFELGKYINFTIPYGWKVGEVDVTTMNAEETIAVSCDNIMMLVSLVDSDVTIKGTDELDENCELIKKYSERYTSGKANLSKRAIEMYNEFTESGAREYVVVIAFQDKTIVVSYSYDEKVFASAEIYFMLAINEMLIDV